MSERTIVGRYVNGIVLNPLEYISNEDGETVVFDSEDEAQKYLTDHGCTEDYFEYLFFLKEVGTCEKCGGTLIPDGLSDSRRMCISCGETFDEVV